MLLSPLRITVCLLSSELCILKPDTRHLNRLWRNFYGYIDSITGFSD
jgi:hypothetical protein